MILLVENELTLELAIHDRRGGKVWSRLADRGSVHIEDVFEDVSRTTGGDGIMSGCQNAKLCWPFGPYLYLFLGPVFHVCYQEQNEYSQVSVCGAS